MASRSKATSVCSKIAATRCGRLSSASKRAQCSQTDRLDGDTLSRRVCAHRGRWSSASARTDVKCSPREKGEESFDDAYGTASDVGESILRVYGSSCCAPQIRLRQIPVSARPAPPPVNRRSGYALPIHFSRNRFRINVFGKWQNPIGTCLGTRQSRTYFRTGGRLSRRLPIVEALWLRVQLAKRARATRNGKPRLQNTSTKGVASGLSSSVNFPATIVHSPP